MIYLLLPMWKHRTHIPFSPVNLLRPSSSSHPKLSASLSPKYLFESCLLHRPHSWLMRARTFFSLLVSWPWWSSDSSTILFFSFCCCFTWTQFVLFWQIVMGNSESSSDLSNNNVSKSSKRTVSQSPTATRSASVRRPPKSIPVEGGGIRRSRTTRHKDRSNLRRAVCPVTGLTLHQKALLARKWNRMDRGRSRLEIYNLHIGFQLKIVCGLR